MTSYRSPCQSRSSRVPGCRLDSSSLSRCLRLTAGKSASAAAFGAHPARRRRRPVPGSDTRVAGSGSRDRPPGVGPQQDRPMLAQLIDRHPIQLVDLTQHRFLLEAATRIGASGCFFVTNSLLSETRQRGVTVSLDGPESSRPCGPAWRENSGAGLWQSPDLPYKRSTPAARMAANSSSR